MTVQRFVFLVVVIDLILLTLAVLLGNRPTSFMGEGKFITWLSAAQLIGLALISGKMYLLKQERGGSGLKGDIFIWRLMALGFFFLAIDEVAQFHENVKRWLHTALALAPVGWSDRLDSFITLIYGIVGLAVIVKYRRALNFGKEARYFLLGGFMLFLLSVMLDAATEQRDILPTIFHFTGWVWISMEWFGVAEESTKILAEASVLGSFYSSYRQLKFSHASAEPLLS